MSKVIRLCLIVLMGLWVTACASGRPDWILAPGAGAVGIAGTHYAGEHSQRKLAIARAREELAARQGVSVENVTVIHSYERGASGGTHADSTTRLETDKTEVRAEVEQFWQDPKTGDLYVLLKPM